MNIIQSKCPKDNVKEDVLVKDQQVRTYLFAQIKVYNKLRITKDNGISYNDNLTSHTFYIFMFPFFSP